MDSIIAEVTSSEFWASVLLGQLIFIGGIVYLIASVSPRRTEQVRTSSNRSQNQEND